MSKSQIKTSEAPQAIGPYSQAIKSGDFLFASGQIPLDPKTGEVVKGGIEEETRQVLANVQAILKAAGTTTAAVVKTTIFLADMGDFAKVNELYATAFSEPFPARSTVQVARLPRDVRVEIEVIAKV